MWAWCVRSTRVPTSHARARVLHQEGGGGDEEDEEEEEEEAPPKKKAKGGGGKAAAAPKSAEENPNKGKATCTTRTGAECPKGIKADQSKMKMSTSKFLSTAKAVEITIDGNTLRGEPRTFSSGNMGWCASCSISCCCCCCCCVL